MMGTVSPISMKKKAAAIESTSDTDETLLDGEVLKLKNSERCT